MTPSFGALVWGTHQTDGNLIGSPLKENGKSIDTDTELNRQYVWRLRYVDVQMVRERDTNVDGTLVERLLELQNDDWETLYAGYRYDDATGLFHVCERRE